MCVQVSLLFPHVLAPLDVPLQIGRVLIGLVYSNQTPTCRPKPQRQGCALERAFGLVLLAGVLLALQAEPTRTWRGLVVAPEYRCSAYTARAYCYPQSVELRIVAAMGARILTAETEEDFAQALDMQGPHDEIEAPIEVLEAFGIQSGESLGIKAEAS